MKQYGSGITGLMIFQHTSGMTRRISTCSSGGVAWPRRTTPTQYSQSSFIISSVASTMVCWTVVAEMPQSEEEVDFLSSDVASSLGPAEVLASHPEGAEMTLPNPAAVISVALRGSGCRVASAAVNLPPDAAPSPVPAILMVSS